MTLPDYLRPGLDVVFVGINPGSYSASVGKYFATPRNRFWGALNRAAMVAAGRDLVPGDEVWLNDYGIGFTDVVKRPSNSASDLRAADFRRWAPVTRQRLEVMAPLVICFNGITGYKWFLQYTGDTTTDVSLGEQLVSLGSSSVFVAPNPSPANAAYSLNDIAGWYRKLRDVRDRLKAGRDL
jgi:TDG/mug DNA glycosylase family protein